MVWQILACAATLALWDRAMSLFGLGKIDNEDLTKYLEDARENFETTRDQTGVNNMNNMLENRKSNDPDGLGKNFVNQGYIYLRKRRAIGSRWVKHYCMYETANRKFTMIAYNQISGRITSTEEISVKSCTRRKSDRLCFDLTADKGIYKLQALSEEDRQLWVDVIKGLLTF